MRESNSFLYSNHNLILTKVIDRHEYSAPLVVRSNSIPKKPPLTRAAFSTPVTRTSFDRPSPIIRHRHTDTSRPLSDITPHTVRFQEPEAMSEDGRSAYADSIQSAGTRSLRTAGRFSKRGRSSIFFFADPAPTAATRKLKLLPKVILQVSHGPFQYLKLF